ncbi:hypothetical protein A4G18_08165 [Pasteurellaceae bacterium Pebbles2]|nr:hypothetical protein [Pasteurellaceae bacterium Pebbles2]
MKLSKSIAQNIVQRTMKIIGSSVNVMDENGVIIASGNPSRLKQKHIGAVLAIRENRIVEIDQELAKKWCYDVQPGINVPITYLEHIIGVIGISGVPAQVKPYAELVKMAAELIVEQHTRLEKERWDRRYTEEFILRLVNGNIDKDNLLKESRYFSFNVESSYVVILIKSFNADIAVQQELISYLQNIKHYQYVAVVDLDKIILLKELVDAKESISDEAFLRYLLPSNFEKKNYRIAIGSIANTIDDIPLSYTFAQCALNYGQRYLPRKIFYNFQQYKLPVLLADLCRDWHSHPLKNYLLELKLQDEKKILYKTLKQFFLSNCDLVHTSKALYIHINTLRYRLDKIERITGLSINKIDEKLVLYLSIMLD